MNDPLRRVTGLSLEEFGSTSWEVAPLLRRAAQLPERDFTELFSPAGADELLSSRGLRTPFLRMSRNGELLAASRFTRSGGAGAEIADQVADDKVLAEFAAGATIVFQGLHRVWPPIVEFAGALAAQLGHPVQVNAYVTPPQNTGFSAHYDTHDVFVLQFAGAKRWRIHEPVVRLPLRDQSWQQRKAAVVARSSETPLLEEVLEPGDVLYLPRGYIHSATSLGAVSGHLTVGVHPVTRRMVADEVLTVLDDELELRRALPLGGDVAASAREAEFHATVAAIHAALDRADPAAVARGIGRHLGRASRPAPLHPLEQVAAASALSPQQQVRLRSGLRVTTRHDGDEFVIAVPDKSVRVAASAADAVALLMSGVAVSAEALPIEIADGVALLAQLLREGIVVPA